MTLPKYEFEAIGLVQSPFHDKFGTPRQASLLEAAKGILKFRDHPDIRTALKSIDEFSHLWIVFVFHDHGGKNWKPSIRPPRLGGSRKVGVLASRSPHRPNPIGLSAVRLDHVDLNANGGPELHVSGLDLINGTPILDIKPYIDYADSIPNTVSGWASQPIEKISITFSHEAELTLSQIEQNDDTKSLRHLIHDVLELDPRPAFQKRKIPVSDPSSQGARFGIELVDYEVKYEIANAGFTITKIETKSESS